MSTQFAPIVLSELSELTLAQLAEKSAAFATLPLSLQLNNEQLHFNSSLEQSESSCELVLFNSTTVRQFLAITNYLTEPKLVLTAINTRSNKTSWRFNVSSKNLSQTKQILAQYALTEKLELAMIENAPKLAQAGVLVMDMDSTTIEIECIDEIAKLAGVGEQVAEVTERAMQGELDFAESLHQRVATLKGADEAILVAVAKNIPLMAGLSELVTELKHHQWRVAIASGGFTYFAEHLQSLLPFDAVFANKLEIINHKLTGKVLGDVVDANAKALCVKTLAEKYAIDATQTVAMGDGANDLVMMAAANLGVAFHAKPIVLKQADTAINFTGLDTMLHWLK